MSTALDDTREQPAHPAGTMTDGVRELLDTLPGWIRQPLEATPDTNDLIEVILDMGRSPEARFPDREVPLGAGEVGEDDLAFVVDRVGSFGDDNRAGLERTLHRISAIRNRRGKVVGLTCRVGRAVYGTIDIIRDIVERGQSLLLLGRPGIGKTTMLREVARVLADDLGKRVIVVDTSNEIAGDGDIPHPGIGRARRMQVPTPAQQHGVMIEAVENHMPEVIIIDEIGTELEAAAARTIAERGVQLVGTAHGNNLANLLVNPTLSDLIGGVQPVTLGDEEARRRGTQKTVLERKAPPTFDVLVEIQERQRVYVHRDVAETVDALLREMPITIEVRERTASGEIESRLDEVWPDGAEERELPPRRARRSRQRDRNQPDSSGPRPRDRSHDWRLAISTLASVSTAGGAGTASRTLRLYPFGVNRDRLEQASRTVRVPVHITGSLDDADALMTLKSYFRKRTGPVREAQARGVPVYVLRSNTVAQMQQTLASAGERDPEIGQEPDGLALIETRDAIQRVLTTSRPMELAPQNAYIRRLQHELAGRYNLASRSLGREPDRRLRIFRPEGD